jgi:hypothetical protein
MLDAKIARGGESGDVDKPRQVPTRTGHEKPSAEDVIILIQALDGLRSHRKLILDKGLLKAIP